MLHSRGVVLMCLVFGAVVAFSLPCHSDDLFFADGFETGDLWAWPFFVGGSPEVGPCPCDLGISGSLFYVDPATGNDATGDGSAGSPWASIQHVVANEVDCTDQYGVPRNPGAPIHGGDGVILVGADGHGTNLDITGCYNSDWVTIRSQTLHGARLESVHFRGSGYWRLDGLDLVNASAGEILRVEDHGSHGPARNIQIVNCRLSSGELPTVQDWVDHVSDGMRLLTAGPLVARCNTLLRVAMGFVAGGDRIDIIGNRVEYFSRDGIATGGHRNRFVGNVIYDSVDLGDGHHDDFFQSHMGANPDTSSDVAIIGNLFMNRYTAGQPAETWGPTQCLSGFEDGPKLRLTIVNNVCKADHWHGITWYDTNNSVVVNNTAIGGSDYPDLPPGSESWPTRSWISIEGTGNTVRNNLTSRNLSGGDHNLEVLPSEVSLYFNSWAGLDLSLAAGSPAVDSGSSDGAPTHDIEGTRRDAQPDVGAYEFVVPAAAEHGRGHTRGDSYQK